MIKYDKKINIRQYIFGDFDNDGVMNIDDRYPFDPKKSMLPDIHDKPAQYHRANLIDNETKFSTQIKKVVNYNNKVGRHMKRFMKGESKKGNATYWRVKSVPSTMKKLVDRNLPQLGDIAGGTILTKKRAGAKKVVRRIQKAHKTDPSKYDDFYSNPKNGVYRAYHLGLMLPYKIGKKKDKNQYTPTMELQVKSREMAKFSDMMHPYYKSKITKEQKAKFMKMSDDLYRRGY